jgi:predicted RNA-binding Zn-ribbon protein involved in translation (DUF1610 family)
VDAIKSVCPQCGRKSGDPLHVESNRVEGTTAYNFKCDKCGTAYGILVSSAGESPRAHPKQ